MRYMYFSEEELTNYPVCFLVPIIKGEEILKAYIDPFSLIPDEILIMDLFNNPIKNKKPTTKEIKEYITQELTPVFEYLSVQYIVVTDSKYFKTLTKATNVDASLGYVLPSQFGPQHVIYIPNYQSIFYDPIKVKAKISQGITALQEHRAGTYQDPGVSIIHQESYPATDALVEAWLDKLLAMNCPLTIDIETFSLKHHSAGIGTISFAWNQHEGIAFEVDYERILSAVEAPFGKAVRNETRRTLLRRFFEAYQQKAIYHHIAFDAYVLVYQLYMKDILDTEGLLRGMGILLKDWDCTKLITYLATNSCAGNKLGLKDQSQEFAGNYAIGANIKDILSIPLDQLLRYNLVDALSTWYVYNKHWDTLVADNQSDIYQTLFKPATVDIIQMQLTGLPVNMARVVEVKALLETEQDRALKEINSSHIILNYNYRLAKKWVEKRNSELKVKRVTIFEYPDAFNPNSDPQMRDLLYSVLGLPELDFTDSKLPATGSKTLEKLLNHADDNYIKNFLQAMLDYASVNKILTSFIPAFLNAVKGPDEWHYLIGNFNLGGTVSGRLSSSDPNLTNIPANSKFGKLIKTCVEAPPGWIFVGLDFESLEDKISALTTKDPKKLKVYTGHDIFSIEINNTIHHIRDDAIIVYDGKRITASDFYNTYREI